MKPNSVLKLKHVAWASAGVLVVVLIILCHSLGRQAHGTGATTACCRGRTGRTERRSHLW